MEYELRIIPECPNSDAALELFRQVLAADDTAGGVRVVEITSEDDAAAMNFHGSPSFISDGNDLFPSETAPGLSCRVYHSAEGLSGLPSREDLAAALRAIHAGP